MSFVDQNTGMYMPVAPAYGGGNSGYGFGNCGDSMWWFVLLILAMNGGWGNGWGNNAGGAIPYMMNSNTNSDVQRGFEHQSVMSSLGDISSNMCNGFAAAESSNNARQIANMQQQFAQQTAITGGLNTLSAQLSQVGALVQSENCEDRNAMNQGFRNLTLENNMNTQRIIDSNNAGFQGIQNKLCQLEMDGIKRDYENRITLLQNALDEARLQNQNARFDMSQTGQTSTIQAGQRALANEIEQYVRPQPMPAYIVQNPNGCNCGNSYNYGCV